MKKPFPSGSSKSTARKSAPPSTSPGRQARPVASERETCTALQVVPSSALTLIQAARRSAGELRGVRFGFFKPEARQVHVVGSFNGWNPRATPMQRDALGDWSVEVELPTGEHRYRFFVDGEWRDDPTAQQTAQNPFGGYDAIMAVV
jgi:1,4-alpha-glucan branching enzyme